MLQGLECFFGYVFGGEAKLKKSCQCLRRFWSGEEKNVIKLGSKSPYHSVMRKMFFWPNV